MVDSRLYHRAISCFALLRRLPVPRCQGKLTVPHHNENSETNKQLIGLSANNVDSHHGWVKDVDNLGGGHLEFPIIGDEDRNVSELYGMLDHQDKTNVDKKGLPFTVRTVFISEFS